MEGLSILLISLYKSYTCTSIFDINSHFLYPYVYVLFIIALRSLELK